MSLRRWQPARWALFGALGALLVGQSAPRRAVRPLPPPRAAAVAGSLLDRLPRVPVGGYAAALRAAQARGRAGQADAAWIELFYGDPAAKAQAEQALAATPTPATPEWDFLQFMAAQVQGQDRQMLQAALHLAEAAPNDPATELAVRALSGHLDREGRQLLDAVPALQRLLGEPLRDPATVYMLGRSLLAAVHAPGVALPPAQAMRLAGRLSAWQLWGPFGAWQNLDFNRRLPIEQAPAATYADGGQIRSPQPYTSPDGSVRFPADWQQQGMDYAVTYVRVNAPTPVLLRFYSAASTAIEINGATVVRNDRRDRYAPATAVAAFELQPGWNRILVKLAGEQSRNFDLMLRPAAGPVGAWTDAATPPAGVALAAPPRLQPAPPTVGSWSARRLAAQPADPVALWVDGIWRSQDQDGEQALVQLQRAAQLAPQAAPVWLSLAADYGQLSDASPSWTDAQTEIAARKALAADPRALRAYYSLGGVYETEGKPTQAARQYARCEGKGYADCDWAAFRLAAGQSWVAEAETALQSALAESGSDWPGVVSGLEFYDSLGEAAKVADWERVLRADPRSWYAFGGYQLNRGNPAAAVPLLRAAVGFAPSSAELRRQYLEALLLSGDLRGAEKAAQIALAQFPNDWRVVSAADEIALKLNPRQGLAQLRRTDFNRNALRYEADFLADRRFWQPWYHSAAQVLKDAPGAAQYPTASAVLVLDQMVDRINPDSTQDQYIHQIYRVLNTAGISQLGDQHIASGSELITVRTIKQDGSVLLPEISNLNNISMPGLEPGDFIEVEYVQHMGASQVIPNTIDNNEFFVFNSSKEPYNYSDYIVLTPPHYPLMVEQARFPGQPKVTHLPNGDTAREWLVQKTRLLTTEPHMPPEASLVPKVWVSSQLSWDDISRYLADHLYAVRKVTPVMRARAQALAAGQPTPVARANAIFDWVQSKIQPGQGSMLAPARQAFADRSGNRLAVFLGLLSAARVPYQLVMARAVTDDSSIKIPSLYQFQFPLVRVPAPGATNPASGWYDLNGNFAQRDYIAPGLRGGLALVAGAAGASVFTHVPSFASQLDAVSLAVTGSVDPAGDATLHLQLTFRGPDAEQVRNALADQPASSLPQVYQQMALANYPNATASGGQVRNLHAHQQPLIISIDATVPDFVHLDGATPGSAWDIQHLVGSPGILSQYAPLPFRNLPLVIAADSIENATVSVTLPASFGQAALPPAASIQNRFGSFQSTFTQTGNRISLTRSLDLNPNLIPPSQYPAFRTFAEAIASQDRLRLTGTLAP